MLIRSSRPPAVTEGEGGGERHCVRLLKGIRRVIELRVTAEGDTVLDVAFTSGLSIFGVVGIGHSLVDLSRARQSSFWPVVEAEVLDSSVEKRRGAKSTKFEPTVRYRYQFAGHLFEGKRIMFAPLATNSQADAEGFLERLRPGTRVLIRVCPSRPRLSVIEPGIDRRAWFALAFFVVFTAFGTAAAYQTLQ